ncbi:hypothetical protein M8C21_028230 [Ambrosia artemisiifolia]|uniref:Disease resistance protein RPS4B/Roq1-like leucine-rich repeats domain-containing protein n=1 Tax=Ambrosia artemisiifolia TaxID=4212 RepID=A0AAD5CXE1_AMBAR|nr:hypothetical protein M8C21_028230 [Ambrosia artemisiifolia]
MKKLRWIDFDKYPASSFPSKFQPRKLGYLRLHCSQQNELWHGYKLLPNLKILHLSSSKNLIKTPDFEGLPCLERLTLKGCESLEEIHPSIGYHKRLVFVDMSWCSGLERFPPIIQMKKLETLNLSYCSQLQQLPDIQSNMDSLVTLDLSDTGIEIIPPLIGRFCTNLVSFDLRNCHKLKRIEGNLHLLKNVKFLYLGGNNFHQDLSVSLKLPQYPRFLRKLDLSDCKLGDGDIPYDIHYLLNLQVLDLSYNIFSRLPSGILRNPGLKFLNLSYCTSLVELLHLPSSIAILKANRCYSLERLGDLSDYKCLWKVSLLDCYKLIYSNRVLNSMLEENAAADRFMSVLVPNVESLGAFTRFVPMQLPHNWYNDFTGFLLVVRDIPWIQKITFEIVIKQEMSTCPTLQNKAKYDKPKYESERKVPEKKKEEERSREYHREQIVMVGYVPFSSLSHIPWLNPAHTKNITFHTNEGVLSVSLVRSKRKVDDLSERPIDYSECWNEEYKDTKIFEIVYDSKSSEIQIVWRH